MVTAFSRATGIAPERQTLTLDTAPADPVAFFRAMLAGAEPTVLPVDRRRGHAAAVRIAVVDVPLARSMVDAARRVGIERATSLFAVVSAPLFLFLRKYMREDDLLLGTVTGADDAVLPIRVAFDGLETMADLIAAVDATYSAARAHAPVPPEALSDRPRAALVSIVCAVHDDSRDGDPQRALAADLALDFAMRGERLRVTYDEALYEPATIQMLADCVVQFLAHGVADADVPLADVRFPASVARAELVGEWLRDAAHARPFRSVSVRMAEIAHSMPQALAVVNAGERHTHGQLAAWADRIRRDALTAVAAGSRVAVVCRDNAAYAAASIAVFAHGCTLVPIDPEYPPSRLELVLQHSAASVLLDVEDAEAPTIDVASPIARGAIPPCPTELGSPLAPPRAVAPELAAYILFTSGSTGTPRGAAVSHGNLSAYFDAALELYDVGCEDRWAWLHTVGFDVSIWETFGPLCTGGSLWIVPKWTRRDAVDLRGFVDAHGITILCHSPSAFYELIRAETAALAGGLGTRTLPGGEVIVDHPHADAALVPDSAFMRAGYARAAAVVRPGDAVVDVGAGIGLACVRLAGHVEGVRWYAFEADAKLAQVAARNFALHAIDGDVTTDTSAAEVLRVVTAGPVGLLHLDLARGGEQLLAELEPLERQRIRSVVCDAGDDDARLTRVRDRLSRAGYDVEVDRDSGAAMLVALRRNDGAPEAAPPRAFVAPRPWAPTTLRYVVLAGEVLDPARLREWLQRHDETLPYLVNNYGITETTIYDTYRAFTREDARRPWVACPVGPPYANLAVRVEDFYGDVVPLGGRGELVLAGDLVGLGYVHREDLTRQKFGRARWDGMYRDVSTYRSGDVARVLRDHELLVEGRIDHQFQLRGFRVEAGEVETVLLGDAALRGAVVQPYRVAGGDSLVAYVVPDPGGSSTADLVARLRARVDMALPEYMRPAAYVALAEWPRTASGKLDRKALPAPLGASPNAEQRTTGDAIEEAVIAVWAEMLGSNRIGWDDDFFLLGGHSLLAARVCAALEPLAGVRVPLRELFRAKTPRSLAKVVRDLRASSAAGTAPVLALTCDPASRYEPFVLTDVQQAYWMGRQNLVGLGAVATHNYVELDATMLDAPRFTAALRQVIARHDMLRCVVGGDMTQRVLQHVPEYEPVVHDLSTCSADEREGRLAEIRERLAYEVRSAEAWPLFAVELSSLPDGRTRMHVSGDALAIDGAGWQEIVRDTLHAYVSDEALPTAPEVTFRDYVLATESAKLGAEYEAARAYWMDRVATLPPAPELPVARPVDQVDQRAWKRLSHTIPADRWAAIRESVQAHGVTPSIALATAYARVLAHFAKSPRFCLNLTLFNRLPLHPDVGAIVGDFTTLLLLEVESREHEPFVTMATRVQEQFFGDFDYRAMSGVEVLRALGRQEGRAPSASMPVVFTSMLSLDGTSALDDLCDAVDGHIAYGISQTSQVWLDHQVMEQSGRLVTNWDFLETLFHPGMVEAMFDAYVALIESLAEDGAWASPVCLPACAPRGDLTTAVPGQTLTEGFVRHALATPERIAIVQGGVSHTYGAALSSASAVARALLACGVTREEPVLVRVKDPAAQVCAVIGVLLAGAAYVPVPPEVPHARALEIVGSTSARFVVADHDDALPELHRIAATAPSAETAAYDAAAFPALSPDELAYVIFTSGTTGVPKGVSMQHGAAMNTIAVMNARFGVGEGDRGLALSALGFDLSVYDIFGLLAAGGALVCPARDRRRDPQEWWSACIEAGVTLWNSVPALGQMFVDYLRGVGRRVPESIRNVWWSGDWIPVELPTAWRELSNGDAALTSLGGATEGGIWSVYYPIGDVDVGWSSVPYGGSLPGQCIEVLDHELRPRPPHVVGEICIAGASLARDYYGLPERTRERFVTGVDGVRWYRTGDLGRRLPDGNIEFLGREDGQVKVRGHRIETAEIEARLLRDPAVAECAVVAKGPGRTKTELVAFVVRGRGAAAEGTVRRAHAMPELPSPLRDVPSGLEATCALLADLEQRARFKESRAYRRALDGEGIALGDATTDASAPRRSTRRFQLRAVDRARFDAWLGALTSFDRAGERVRRYGSAGGLYPVQTYIAVKPGRVDGLAAGTYWLDPDTCALRRVSGAWALAPGSHAAINEQLAVESACSLYFVLDLAAIAPIYGESSERYATLEAGAMVQLLEMTGERLAIGLCQLGAISDSAVAEQCRLGTQHRLLHAAVAGVPELEDVSAPRPAQSHEMRARALVERVAGLTDAEAAALEVAILEARNGANGLREEVA